MGHPRHSASQGLVHLVLDEAKPKLFGLLFLASTNILFNVSDIGYQPELIHHVVGPRQRTKIKTKTKTTQRQ